MSKSGSLISIILALIFGVVIGISVPDLTEKNSEFEINTQTPLDGSLFEQVDTSILEKTYNILRNNHVDGDEIDAQKLEEWMIRGILYSIDDPYTEYFNEEQNEEFQNEMKGDFEGIGAVLEKTKQNLSVTEVLPGYPAAEYGILPGDIIVQVDGEETKDETIWESVLRIRGEKGSKVELEIYRNGEIKTITVTRDKIHVNSVDLEWKGENEDIALLTVSQFGDDLKTEWREKFLDVQEKNPKGIIVDMRYNGGGYVTGAIDLVSHFIEQNKTVLFIEDKDGKLIEEKSEYRKYHDYNTPVVILINPASASAAEIFTGALQDYGRATVVGEESFGKGSMQQLIPAKPGSSQMIKITIAKWLTPERVNVNHEDGGIVPDEVVEFDRSELTDEQREQRFDPQLDKAVEILEK